MTAIAWNEDQTPTCSDPAYLPLVDAAYERPGGPAAQYMAREVCRRCPIAASCLDLAMHQREWGVWGGTTPTVRTLAGAPGSGAVAAVREAS